MFNPLTGIGIDQDSAAALFGGAESRFGANAALNHEANEKVDNRIFETNL